MTPDGASYGDRQPRPAAVSSSTIAAINSEHSVCVRSSIDLRSACAPAGQQLFANLPRRRAGWTGSLRSRFRNSAPSLCTYGKGIGTNELIFIRSTMLTPYDAGLMAHLHWPHGTFCAPGSGALWIAGMAENLILLYVRNVPRTRTILGSHQGPSGTHVGDLGSRSHASGAMDGSDVKPR